MKLKFSQINKSYGDKKALVNINMTLGEGVYGLLGPNGAGKSTLMNIIAGNLTADNGIITYEDVDIIKLGKDFRNILGYMPQQQGLYDNFTGFRFLSYIAALKGIEKKQAKQDILEAAKCVNLIDELDKKLKAYSGGMKQRILIAQAILGNPKVLILDEPTAGLDPKERIRIRNLISQIALDKIVILATHVVTDIEYIAKEVILLKKGEMLAKEEPKQLLAPLFHKVFEINTEPSQLMEITKKYRVGNIGTDGDEIIVRIISDTPPKEYVYQSVKPTLEDEYLYVFEDEVEP